MRIAKRYSADRGLVSLLLCTALVPACGSESSGLEVIVEAEQEVAARSSRVLFEVRTQEGDVALSERFDLDQTPFPIRRMVAPRGGDVSRIVTITARAVNASGDTLTTARIIRSFVPGRRVEVRLRLYELCLGTNCPEGLTCEPIAGRAECVDARVTEGAVDAGVDSDAPSVCPGTQMLCDDKCVDTQSDEAHCGQCGRACSSEQVCSNGSCQIVSCDGPADCSSGNYCNLNTGRCLPGCDEPTDCGDNSSCNMGNNQCECASGYHRCSSACLPDNAVGSCGDRCAPCEGLSNGTASCQPSGDAFICASMCNDGFNLCNGSCALASSPASCGPSCTVCPGSSRGTAICNAGTCSLLCNQGTTMCPSSDGQDCVDTTSDANHCGTCGRVCSGGQICQGSSCIEPPNCDVNNPASCTGLTYCNPNNNRCAAGCDPRLSNQCGSNQTCSANQCVCSSGTHECGGVCLSNSSVNSCGSSCSTCPLVTNATQMGCNGTSCTVIFCVAGYQPSGQSCEDVDECLSNNGGCHANATCRNTAGSRTCTCNSGFSGNGLSCAAKTSTWRRLNIVGAPARQWHAMAYDSAMNRVVLFGGNDGDRLSDTWILSGDTWSQITGPGPSARDDHAMAYDSAMNRVVLFGGWNGISRVSETWVLSGSAWSQITDVGPLGRDDHAAVYDSAMNRVVLFGGWNGTVSFSDTWVLTGSTWSQLTGPGPSRRSDHATAYDSALNRVVLFGGVADSYLGDTWVLTGSTWSQLTGPGPSARTRHAMVYDSAMNRVVLFGGSDGSGRLRDTWVLSGSTWRQIADSGPSARSEHSMVYDSTLNRVVLFGGNWDLPGYANDTWVFE